MKNPNKQKYLSGQICGEISNETPSITYIPTDNFHQHRFGQDLTVVLSFQRYRCNGVVCLARKWAHQLKEEMLKCQAFLNDNCSGNDTEFMQSKHWLC